MKHEKLLTAGKLALAAALMVSASSATAGIANTKHNLSDAGLGTQQNSFSGTGEICVFCHTPHGADTSASVPLWNRVLADPGTYTTYDTLGTSTLDGDVEQIGSVSIACLSCHDGTQALNVMINQPGSGGFNPAGDPLAGTWTGPASGGAPVGSLAYGTIVNIGQDLTNDHPIGIQYGGGGITSSAPTAATNDSDFTAPQNGTLNGSLVWWVDTAAGSPGTREKTDMQLYTRTGTVSTLDEPFVECASCHDPHVENTTFLRIDNAGSAVCLACHTK